MAVVTLDSLSLQSACKTLHSSVHELLILIFDATDYPIVRCMTMKVYVRTLLTARIHKAS